VKAKALHTGSVLLKTGMVRVINIPSPYKYSKWQGDGKWQVTAGGRSQ